MTAPDATARPRVDRSMILGDGRSLAWAEWGRPAGRPVFLLHGMPGSRLLCPDERVTGGLEVRLITLDRPGYGGSDPRPGRRIVDGAADIAELAAHLGVTRWSVVGWSSGGPYALACAATLGDRIASVSVVASDAPVEEAPNLLDEESPGTRDRIAAIQRGDPEAVALLETRIAPYAADPDRLFGSNSAGPDAAVRIGAYAEALGTMMREAFRQGVAGFRDDWIATYRPWGFHLADVTRPVTIWRGDADQLSSAAHAEHLAANVPGARLVNVPGGGHSIAATEWRAILGELFRAADVGAGASRQARPRPVGSPDRTPAGG